MGTYVNLVYKFYSSLMMTTDTRNNLINYVMEFQLHGRECKVTLEMLTKWLDCNHEGVLNALSDFRSSIT